MTLVLGETLALLKFIFPVQCHVASTANVRKGRETTNLIGFTSITEQSMNRASTFPILLTLHSYYITFQ